MDSVRCRRGKRSLVRIAVVLAAVGLAALLLGGAWMKGWWDRNGAGEASTGQEREYDLGNGVKLTLCWYPPGKFLMGSPASEPGRLDNEEQHEVTLSRGFWMGKTETTQEQWEAVMSGNPSKHKGRRLPVDSLTWDEAKAFAAKCTERLRKGGALPAGWEFRLPAEAQWEYACRAETAT